MTKLALSALSTVRNRYDRLFCDIWGVVHNGAHNHPEAVAALIAFRQSGGQVALVTNAPRPHYDIEAMLTRLDVPPAAYDVVVSSGDVTQNLIAAYAGETVHHVGPDYDLNLFEGTGVTRGAVGDAKVIIVSDLDEKGEELADYAERLQAWQSRNLPLICANPDKFVEVGDRMVMCGGALADAYAQMGGEVIMAGKPFAPIYDLARQKLMEHGCAEVPNSRTLAIGDAERTDASGASAQGVDFLMITGSVHASDLHQRNAPARDDDVLALLADSGVHLIGHQRSLR